MFSRIQQFYTAAFVALSLLVPACLQAQTQKPLAGTWTGTLDAGQVKLRIVFNITDEGNGKWSATMDSPDQGAKGIPTSGVRIENDSVIIQVAAILGAYEGKLTTEGASIEGTWKQAGRSFPLPLKRTETAPVVNRPQMPKKPYPYLEEEVSYQNATAGITLAGTLTKPSTGGPFPAVLLITGSGSQDRNESLMGHSPFLILADYLTRRGIAVLRVDDRGVGGSTGDPRTSTTEDFVGDVLAGVQFLKQRKDIRTDRIGLIGHSEGGVIAPMAAARSNDVAFIVLMAGTGLPGDEILLMQSEIIMQKSGSSEETIAAAKEINSTIYATIRKEKNVDSLRSALSNLLSEQWENWGSGDNASETNKKEAIAARVNQISAPWFRYFITLDPREAMRKVKCPVLAINGELDVQVPPRENLREIEQALKSGGNNNITIRELPGLNHLFQTATTGLPTEYGSIEETISPAALSLMGEWIETQVKR